MEKPGTQGTKLTRAIKIMYPSHNALKRAKNHLGIGFQGLADKNIECPVKFECQIDNEMFLVYIHSMQYLSILYFIC